MSTFFMEHLNNTAIWVAAIVVLAVLAIVSIKKLAEQPFFGGRKHMGPLEEHYVHGDMTTEEYEDQKSHRHLT
jgi:uncharacterized membrane protein